MTGPLKGVQVPRIMSVPDGGATDLGEDACDWLAANGLILDPWQRTFMVQAMAEWADDRWAAFDVGLVVGRQNGKSLLLAAREMIGMFLLGEDLIIHTAHQWKTAHKSFLTLQKLVRASPELMARVKRFSSAPGTDVLLMKDGRTVEFIARSKASGRGWSADLVIMDEAYDLSAEMMGALMPTLSAMPNPQIWFASSAPMARSDVLHSLRDRAIAGESSRLCFMEWSAPEGCDPTDRTAWAQANPSLGIRISEEFFEVEQQSLDAHEFGRECLGWPDSPGGVSVFPDGAWTLAADSSSAPSGQVAFAVDVNPSRSLASIGVAGLRRDGLIHVELIDCRPGTEWIVGRLLELDDRWSPVAFVIDEGGPAGSLVEGVERAGLTVVRLSMRQVAQATGLFFDAVVHEKSVRHRAQPPLDAAVLGASQRPLGDAWTWGRRNSVVEVSPLVAVTLAYWGLNENLDGGGLAPDDVYVGVF